MRRDCCRFILFNNLMESSQEIRKYISMNHSKKSFLFLLSLLECHFFSLPRESIFCKRDLFFFYPYPSTFSFRGGHLLPGQDLDAISIPFQIYFIQATTTTFLEPVKLQQSSFWCGSLGGYNLITGFITAKAIGSQRGCLLFTQVDCPQGFLVH